jgi:hypothetical protein
MAILLSVSTGNLSATASWAVVEPTSFQGTPNTAVTSTNTVVTLVTGTSFTLASSVTVAGVALQLSGRVVSPTGTLNVQLFDNTGAAIIGQVTINISDLPNSNGVGNNHIDWTYFKFASPVTTIAGRTYAIRTQVSVGSQYSYYYTTGTTNTNRALITTTNQAPVSSDVLIVAGEYTAAGVNAPVTITMDLPSITLGNVWVSSRGVLKHITTSSTTMSLSGYLVIGVAGEYTIGTSVDPIPSIYSVTLTMNCTTALQYPIWVYGAMSTYGEGFTGFPATKVIATKLAEDVVVGATTSTTSTATGWSNGDIIAIPSTTRTSTQYETKTLNTNASGTTLTHNAYTFAHGGNATTKVQADIVNLTRNILITGAGVVFANKTNIIMFPTSRTFFYYTRFRYMGTGITMTNSGICVNALTTFNNGTPALFTMGYCVMIEGTQAAANTANTALQTVLSTGISISNNIFYGLGWTVTTVSTIIATQIDDGNYIIGCAAGTQALLSTYMGSNNVVASTIGLNTVNAGAATTGFLNNATNNLFYSNNAHGVNIINPNILGNTNLSNFQIWRNNNYGLRFDNSALGYQRTNIVSFTGLYCFGNTTGSILTTIRIFEKIYFINSFFYGGSTLVQPTHFIGSGNVTNDSIYYENCYFGYSDTSLTASPFSGVILQNPTPAITKIFSNCYFNGTEISGAAGQTTINLSGTYISLNHNGLTASNKQWFSNGIITTDTTIFLSGNRSLRLSPSTALYKLTTPLVKVPVKIGTTCTISVKVRESSSLDLATYNGNLPRLMYAFNPVLGNLTEMVGATFPSITNLLTFPEDFDNGIWGKFFGASITPNTLITLAPDNTYSSDIFNTSVGGTTPLIGRVPSSVAGSTYSLSIYVKSGTNNFIQIRYTSNATLNSYIVSVYNTTLGTITQTAVGSVGGTLISNSITSVGNGWFRLALVASIPQSDLNVGFFMAKNGTGNIFSNTGTITNGGTFSGTENMYIWGTLLELGSVTSTYISQSGWQELSYTTATFSNDGVAEFYVDCDGTAGWINVDDWNVTTSVDSRSNDYWDVNGTYVEPDFKRRAKSYTFVM